MTGRRRSPGLKVHFTDFANMLKAFIGSNYLTIAFAFRQSGLALGIAGLIAIATLTAHCCHLLAKCKYHAIRHIINMHQQCLTQSTESDQEDSSDSDDDSDESDDSELNTEETINKKLRGSLNYGDLGRLCLGKAGVVLVNVAIVVTQFGFCLGYCIFIGNTMLAMFPLYNCTVPVVHNNSLQTVGQQCVKITHLNALEDVYDVHVNEVSPSFSTHSKRDVNQNTWHKSSNSSFIDTSVPPDISHGNLSDSGIENNETTGITVPSNSTTHIPDISFALPETTAVSRTIPKVTGRSNTASVTTTTTTTAATASTSMWPVWTNVSHTVLTRGKGVPNLKLLVLCPVAVFIFMALIRSVRQLGIISAMANAAILVGCVEVLIFLIVGFNLSTTFKWYNLHSMPIFFGLVTSSYEGIGTILPIESSMEGNRHNFTRFLFGAVIVLTMVLASFGVMGYLRFGEDVEQMINANIPSGSWLSIAVNICLCIGVLLTFPLMMYPVTDLAELYLFGKGRLLGPRTESGDEISTDRDSLLPKKETEILLPVAEKVSDKVPTWKRNILRTLIVLLAGGLAVLLKDNFAYISAFVGALGSTMLAYILPCVFHLRLCWSHLPMCIKVKDIGIIILGLACSVTGVYSVLVQIVNNMKN